MGPLGRLLAANTDVSRIFANCVLAFVVLGDELVVAPGNLNIEILLTQKLNVRASPGNFNIEFLGNPGNSILRFWGGQTLRF